MEFIKIATVIIVGAILLLEWLSNLASDWKNFTKGEMFMYFIIEPFCLFGMVLIAMELWG